MIQYSKSATLCAIAVLSSSTIVFAEEDKDQAAFFDTLASLCGNRYEGSMTFPVEGQDSFAGKTLVAHIKGCTDSEIRIPFAVGEDRSRTWIITRTNKGLQLKHDHRHKDGTPDEINLYGGLAQPGGTPLSQAFAADAHTAKIIPAASTNVWTLSLSDEAQTFTYHLERHQAPRFTAILNKAD